MNDIMPEDTVQAIARRYAGTGQIEALCRSHERLRRMAEEHGIDLDHTEEEATCASES